MTDTLLAASTDSPAADATADTDATAEAAAIGTATSEAQADAAADASAEGDAAKGNEDNEAAPGAPETYADFTVPEGVALDEATVGEFSTLAKELNLPQEQAQRVVDIGVQMAQRWAEESQTALTEMQAEWRRTAEADPEIGGEALAQNLSIAKKALDAFASPAFRQELEATKLGDHPEFIRMMVKAGKAMSEDTLITPSGTAKAERSLAERIYGNQQ